MKGLTTHEKKLLRQIREKREASQIRAKPDRKVLQKLKSQAIKFVIEHRIRTLKQLDAARFKYHSDLIAKQPENLKLFYLRKFRNYARTTMMRRRRGK